MRRVVLCNGTFDPLHYGHLLHLEAARKFGTELVVALTSDGSTRREKGEGRPLFSQSERAAMLKALRCVDKVVIVDTAEEALRRVWPNVFVKGSDYSSIQPGDATVCEELGVEVRFTDTPKWSATKVVDALRGR